MSKPEQQDLVGRWRELMQDPDKTLIDRYKLRPLNPTRLSLYRRFRIAVGLLLRRLGLRKEKQPWQVTLGHSTCDPERAKPLLICAFDCDRERMREACTRLDRRLQAQPEHAPVLVTNVADFAFYSRLGWMVEFIPDFSGFSRDYSKRKLRYLAWLYRGAPIIELPAGPDEDSRGMETADA